MGNHSTDSGKTLRNPATPLSAGTFGGPGSTKLGNEVALNVGGAALGLAEPFTAEAARKHSMARSIPASQLPRKTFCRRLDQMPRS